MSNNHVIQIAPSILSADFARLAASAKEAIEGGATLLHVDVMDGHFVPNITIGPPVVASLRKAISSDIPLDCHLMIENADEYIPAFADAGADWISVHQEACVHLHRVLQHIKGHGLKAGVVINPATPIGTLTEVLDMVDYVLVMSVNPGFGGQKFIPSCLEKIRKLAAIQSTLRTGFKIEVDGGITLENIAEIVRAGAEVIVAGSAVFGSGDPRKNTERLLKTGREANLLQV
ncbi:MAG: ribulose-5-phosphate 3-epimerase [Acidobacteriaceae bacterium]|nr:ribulose-5-phosphate 3-epimerase [Acidobacteriaceae bacterium]